MAFLFPTYFPFCIYDGEGDVGDGTYYPVGMSLEDAMALYWKAKSFRIVETWNTIQQDTNASVTGTTDTILTPSGNLDTMTDVSCRPLIEASGNAGTFSIYFPQAGGDPGPFAFQDFLAMYLFGDVGVVYRNGLYYPQISFSRQGGFYQYIEWNSFSSGIQALVYPASIKINENQYNFNMYLNNAFNSTDYYNTRTDITIFSERLSS